MTSEDTLINSFFRSTLNEEKNPDYDCMTTFPVFILFSYFYTNSLYIWIGYLICFLNRMLRIVLLGGLTVVIIHFTTGMSMPMLVGIMSGAVTRNL
jgi:hypothetical protein